MLIKTYNAKENFADNHFQIISRLSEFAMFYQIFFLPQVKRGAIITYKYGIYQLTNHLRLRFLGNYGISEKSQNFIER